MPPTTTAPDFLIRHNRLHLAHSAFLPDPDLSECVWPLLSRLVDSELANPGWSPPRPLFRALDGRLRLCAGRARTTIRSMEPA